MIVFIYSAHIMKDEKLQEQRFANNLAYLDPVKAAFVLTYGHGFTDEEIKQRCDKLLSGFAGEYYHRLVG